MTVYRNQGQWDRSNVEFSEGRIVAYDKINQTQRMHYIDYGLGIFNKAAFRYVPDNTPYDLAPVYQHLISLNQLAAFECHDRFYEIGSVSGIKTLETHLLEKRKDTKYR
jgi:NDP-sugar pyrophosphorylase family protein